MKNLELYINFFLYYGRITARKKKTKQTGNYAFRTLIVFVSRAIKWDRKHMKGVEFKQCLLNCFTKSNTFIFSLMHLLSATADLPWGLHSDLYHLRRILIFLLEFNRLHCMQ